MVRVDEELFAVNPFVPNAPFLYPPKASENLWSQDYGTFSYK